MPSKPFTVKKKSKKKSNIWKEYVKVNDAILRPGANMPSTCSPTQVRASDSSHIDSFSVGFCISKSKGRVAPYRQEILSLPELMWSIESSCSVLGLCSWCSLLWMWTSVLRTYFRFRLPVFKRPKPKLGEECAGIYCCYKQCGQTKVSNLGLIGPGGVGGLEWRWVGGAGRTGEWGEVEIES